MKHLDKILFIVLLTFLSSGLMAQGNAESNDLTGGENSDTVYFFKSWEAVFNHRPDFAYAGNIVFPNNDCEIEIWTQQEEPQEQVDKKAIAACVGDSLWLINSNYLLTRFKSSYKGFNNYVTLYFSGKLAFVRYWDDYPSEYGYRSMINLDGDNVLEPVLYHEGNTQFYLLDFEDRAVKKIDYKLLTHLLEPYPDLQRRYLGMKRYKEAEIIDFFLESYTGKVNSDPQAPTILEMAHDTQE